MKPRPRTLKARTNATLRWLHIYTSMISLLVVLFFSLTGITLNHPDWTFGSMEARRELSGTLPRGWIQGESVDWLTVAEDLRAAHNLRGRAQDTRFDAGEASLSFRAPGYSADVLIEAPSGKYSVNVDAQGFVAVMNDLHRGRDAGSAWAWVIDVSGLFLTLISVTGLALLFYLRKIRVKALLVMVGGAVVVIALMRLAT
ncbi:PepSY-associated TM helix domain-containing protein [Deinococcus yavapaiensis]|uniref:PepSY-associated transmembrane protein n=1 Tax=Deinococcus yavapaiensis KR-236 TaxID=694435 RepID=A0A318SAH5_9DEIO|nr:PepSY-associated TM helix domain-containing protein [Deinococcus yavapaiensis]PYE53251.1 hypothetical protein DES52_10923 [Deinococcus yavapaiensis KR-236]